MIETNSDFIDSYITNNDGNIVNKDIYEYLMDIEINDLNVLHMNIRSYRRILVFNKRLIKMLRHNYP